MLPLLILFQAAAPAPDIQLDVHVRAKSVEIRQKGEARQEVNGAAGSKVETRVEPKADGRARLRNVRVDIHAQASAADRAQIRAKAETGTPK